MKAYKLLTPGPLTTSDSVKQQMLFDYCTWDDDYKSITQEIRKGLLQLAHASEDTYTVVLMQGSGTFGVESVITSVVPKEGKILIASNGEYGRRMFQICEHAGIDFVAYDEDFDKVPNANIINEMLENDAAITHVAMVHSETTSGILNDIESVGKVVKANNCDFIVDAMSSFGGIDIEVEKLQIDYLVSSANKCIQGVPGFSFVICREDKLIASEGNARSLSLDLFDQWKTMNKDGKWRYTSPTHVVKAFYQAMKELEVEGGIVARQARYTNNNTLLIKRMAKMGMKAYIDNEYQGPIITTFYYPENTNFSFIEMYDYIKERGYAIYPGKLTSAETFRIGNIGEIFEEDINDLCDIIEQFLKEKAND